VHDHRHDASQPGDDPRPRRAADPGPAAWPRPLVGPGESALRHPRDAAPGERFAELPVAAIVPSAARPVPPLDAATLAALTASIEMAGFLQPVVVREVAPGRYELLSGERWWRAAQELGHAQIPAIVRDAPDDAALQDALRERTADPGPADRP
jgi:ParB family transcriptional regulator, chromosome partitioning protein